jgi:NAD(P)-dependent dehydrogenase (short-subunit alcohol dehydrogenase family)
MRIRHATALVTGANRGFGRHLAAQLLERGASRVYAASRDSAAIDLPGVVPLRLDITNPDDVAHAADVAGDITILINNAGVGAREPLLTGDLAQIRAFMDTAMAARVPAAAKSDPAVIAARALDGIEAGRDEVIADDQTAEVKAALSRPGPPPMPPMPPMPTGNVAMVRG